MKLTIISWNMLVYNERIDDAFEFVRDLEYDILCLQEVPPVFLERLEAYAKTKGLHLVSGNDSIWQADAWNNNSGEARSHLVTLSQHPLSAREVVAVPHIDYESTLRTKIFHLALHLTGIWKGGQHWGREQLFANVQIETPEGIKTVRVCCAHISLTTPAIRTTEIALALSKLSDADTTSNEQMNLNRPSIMCGDFNIIDFWLGKPWNWLQGAQLYDGMPWSNERKQKEGQFAAAGFTNALSGLITHPAVRSQLDHILVPKTAKITSREVIKDRHGSDHCAIRTTIEL